MRATPPAQFRDHFATNPAPPTMRITRRLEFDAGHRIPNHQSQCRHLHGHRYALEVTLVAVSYTHLTLPTNREV